MISSLLNVAYLIPVFARGFFGPHDEEKAQMADTHHNDHDHNSADHAASGSRIVEAPLFCVVPLWVTALGCVALFLYADRLYAMLEPIVK